MAGQANAIGYGSSIEGDSAGVTLTLNTARDSAWIRFASPYNNFYDSIKAVPISGSSNKILIAPYLDLDTLGGHIVVAYTFTGDTRTDTIAGAWYHRAAIAAASGLDTLSTTFVARLVDEINSYAFYATKGAVGGSPATTGFSSAALTETAEDHWNDNMFAMFTGSRAGEAGRVTAFTPATDSITFTPPFKFAPAVGDSFFIFTLISESGSGASNWSDAQRDSVLNNMKDGAITATKIATSAIGADEIATDAIGALEIAAGAIGSSEIATDAIGSSEIATDAIGKAELNDNVFSTMAETLWVTRAARTITGDTYTPDVNITQVAGDAIVDNNDGLLEVNVEKWKDQVPLDPAVSGAIQANVYEMVNDVISADKIADDAFTSDHFADSALLGINFDTDYYDTLTQIVSDNAGTVTLPDSLFDKIDSILTSTGDSLNIHVGRAGSSTPTVSLHMKQGDYSGAAGSNIEDDFDTVLVKIAAIAIGSGSGANACTIYAKAGSDFIQGVNVRLQSSGGTDYYDDTDSDGKAVFTLDDGTYYGYATVTGHTQDVIPDTFTFTADYNDTLLMTPFAPTAPAGDLTTLYNWIVDGNDQPIKNVEIEAYIPQKFWPVKNTNKAIKAQHAVRTDSAGLWELPIFGNDIVLTDQGDSSSYWMVTATNRGDQIFKHKVTVSSDSSTQLMVPDDD
jgi:hypothetical protein